MFPVDVSYPITTKAKQRMILIKDLNDNYLAFLKIYVSVALDQTAYLTVDLTKIGLGYTGMIDQWNEKLNLNNINQVGIGLIVDLKENLNESDLDVIASAK